MSLLDDTPGAAIVRTATGGVMMSVRKTVQEGSLSPDGIVLIALAMMYFGLDLAQRYPDEAASASSVLAELGGGMGEGPHIPLAVDDAVMAARKGV